MITKARFIMHPNGWWACTVRVSKHSPFLKYKGNYNARMYQIVRLPRIVQDRCYSQCFFAVV